MIHKTRRYSVKRATPDEIAADMERCATWTLCTGYQVEHDGNTYLVLNDAFSENGAQEYAILKVDDFTPNGFLVRMHESLTVSWVKPQELAAKLLECFNNPAWDSMRPFQVIADPHTTHPRCYLCS